MDNNRNMMKSQMLGRQNMYRMMSDNPSNRRDMSFGNMMSGNILRDNNMMSRNMMRDNDMMSRNMYSDRMGDYMGAMMMDRDMMATQNMELMGQDMSSNMMLNSYKNGDNLTGDRNSMSQRMAVQRFPELSSRFF